MDTVIQRELEDFARKASGDRKTQVAACVAWSDGRKIFGANRLRDAHGLTGREIAGRIRPRFYDAMKCAEADAIDKAEQLGLDFAGVTLYSLLFPCPRCAARIAETKIKVIVAARHRTGRNGKFDNPLARSQEIFDRSGIEYDAGEPDGG